MLESSERPWISYTLTAHKTLQGESSFYSIRMLLLDTAIVLYTVTDHYALCRMRQCVCVCEKRETDELFRWMTKALGVKNI